MVQKKKKLVDLPEIYQGEADGLWHIWLPTGRRHPKTGKPIRKHIKRKDPERLRAVASEHLEQLKSATTPVAGRPDTVAQWLRHWLDTIVRKQRAYKTWAGYKSIIEQHLVPRIGHHTLRGDGELLQPEHLDQLYADLADAGLAPSYVLQVHRVLSRSLKVAHRRGVAARNACGFVDAPRFRKHKPKPLGEQVARKVIAQVLTEVDALRWVLALFNGVRQSETLGLELDNIEYDDAGIPLSVVTARQVQRHTWQHGCTDPVACALPHCRTRACRSWEHGCGLVVDEIYPCGKRKDWACPARQPAHCRRHARACPQPCPVGCTDHARLCPAKIGGGLVLVDLKSEDSERVVPFDPYTAKLVQAQVLLQKKRRLAAGESWPLHGTLFTTSGGELIDPRDDHERWEEILIAAEVPDAKLHAARHTAATFMVATGADLSVVQELLGHSRIDVTKGYVEAAKKLKRKAVNDLASSWLRDAGA